METKTTAPRVEPGASTAVTLPRLNRKMRRALRHGHTLKPEHWAECGYVQRVRKCGLDSSHE